MAPRFSWKGCRKRRTIDVLFIRVKRVSSRALDIEQRALSAPVRSLGLQAAMTFAVPRVRWSVKRNLRDKNEKPNIRYRCGRAYWVPEKYRTCRATCFNRSPSYSRSCSSWAHQSYLCPQQKFNSLHTMCTNR